jgi:hypothetical protein
MRLELSTFRTAGNAGVSGGLMSQWRVGAIVEAVAVRDADDGQLWLNIGGARIPARIASGDPTGPINGEKLQLRVLRDKPVLALETVAIDDQDAVAINEGLRRFLPRQTSSAPLFANLALLAERDEGGALGRPVAEAARRLWQALPNANQLTTADGLAAAAKRSGAFMEHQLAQGDPNEVKQTALRDIKALLGALKQALTQSGAIAHRGGVPSSGPLPSLQSALVPIDRAPATLAGIDIPQRALNELAGQTEGALARLNTLQLVNAETSSPTSGWLLEIPFRRDGEAETLRFRFERSLRGRDGEQAWTVETAMDLGEEGAFHARLVLQGTRLGVQLRAESPTLFAELETHSRELIATLEESGLQVDRVVCLRGMPANEPATRAAPLFTTPLLDITV